MIILTNKDTIKVEFVKKKEFSKYLNNKNWNKSELLSEKSGEEIYVSNKNKILVNCIYGPKGLLFESLSEYEEFIKNCSFIYIPSEDTVFFIEKIDLGKFQSIVKDIRLEKEKSLSNQVGADIYVDEDNRIFVLDNNYKSGLVYSNINEFLLIRREYGFDDSELIVPIGKISKD